MAHPRLPRCLRALVVALVLVAGQGVFSTSAANASTSLAKSDTGSAGGISTPAPALIASAATTSTQRTYGAGPLNDVLFWADEKKKCGLTRNQLAAMMMAPTFPETGAFGPNAPSPMTLSRWDNQAGLYAFGEPSTSFPKAFWHPGAGMWQFDSAGFWNLSGAMAINSYTSAQQAAIVMANRWCVKPTRAHAWGPWFACSTTNLCEDIYNQIFDGENITNLATDASVTSEGGMQTRTCNSLTFGAVSCAYVDPSKAQGYKVWAAPGFGPSPISAPFYVFSVGSMEYRSWLTQDTGYPVTIVASKPITANARTSLSWVARDDLCDLTAMRGACDRSPFGSLDVAGGGAASVYVRGWAIDPDSDDPTSVHVYVDDKFLTSVSANQPRPDVAGPFPLFGVKRGYEALLPGIAPGRHTVCTYGINVGIGANATLGCKTFDEPAGNPIGSLDETSGAAGQIRVRGWGFDPDTLNPLAVHVYVDDVSVVSVTANQLRGDVANAWPAFGTTRGYDVTIGGIAPGTHRVCAFGIDAGPGPNPSLGCRVVTLASGGPIGSLDQATPGFTTAIVSGWVLDPDTSGPVVVHIYVDGTVRGAAIAEKSRPDLVGPYPFHGASHGFSFAVSPVGGGTHSVCAYGINSAGPGESELLNCLVIESSGDPSGALDAATPLPGLVKVRGWAIDPDSDAPIDVHVYVDGALRGVGSAREARRDVGAAYSPYGSEHGYDFAVSGVGGGPHSVCTYAVNVGVGENSLLGCRAIHSPGEPFGSLDTVTPATGSETVRGWAIDPDTSDPINVHIYVDGVGRAIVLADRHRNDVFAAYPNYGGLHEFAVTISDLSGGAHNVCAYGINVGLGAGNTTLGCVTA